MKADVVKAALMDAFDREASVWAERRHGAHDDASWWEAKSRWMLLLEAKALVHTVPTSASHDAAAFVAAVADRIASHREWGWGANWPDDVHARAFAWLQAFLARSIVAVLANTTGSVES
jgi:hypothetical protein